MELRPPLHLGVVAIEKGAFGLPLTKVANFTYVCKEKKEENSPTLNMAWMHQYEELKTIEEQRRVRYSDQ